MSGARPFTVVDLFSGGGGMSYGFHAHPAFELVGAVDAQLGKPSSARGSLACNSTYALNMGFEPTEADLSTADPDDLGRRLGIGRVDVLSACPPCTGFSRTNSRNHLIDDHRNALVVRVADFARAWQPTVIVMENARELLAGNFRGHFDALRRRLEALGYDVHAEVHMLTRFGLPQIRERALVVATRGVPAYGLDHVWSGYRIEPDAVTVERALVPLRPLAAGTADPDDPDHVTPSFASETGRARIAAVPHDGGSWRDLLGDGGGAEHLTPAMTRLAERGALGSFPDVYGRMAWGRPAPTIKRECAHVGNGRYAHPVEDRLCSLREMAVLNGFPAHYRFGGTSLANKYRHVGDAVPPLISYQIAWAAHWSLTGVRPEMDSIVLPHTTLTPSDITAAPVVGRSYSGARDARDEIARDLA